MRKILVLILLLFFLSVVNAKSCFDSDDGLNYYQAGYVKFDNTTYYDNCVNEKVLIEGYCSDGYFKTTTYYCPDKCLSGTCLSTQNLIWSEVFDKTSKKISQIEIKSWEKPLKIKEVELPRIPKEEVYSRYVDLNYNISAEEALKRGIVLPEGFYETNNYLIGNVVASLVYVQYNEGEWWTEEEIMNSFLNASAGLLWLKYFLETYSGITDIGIEWNITGEFAVIDTNPFNYSPSDDEIWIGKVMEDLGYDPSYYGVYEYVNYLRNVYQANWGFVIFMVKGERFDGGPSAYARHWGPYAAIAVHEEPDWGFGWLMPVTAHETLHVFGAYDEYCDPGTYCCECNSNENYFKISNLKCEAACFGHLDECYGCIWGGYCNNDEDCESDEYCENHKCKHWCLMSVLAPYICPISRAQIGWVDCDSNGHWWFGSDCVNRNICRVGEYSLCGSNCPAYDGDEVCKGKIAGKSWCDGSIKKTCDSNCKYLKVDCKTYGSHYTCINGRCIYKSGGCPVLKAWGGEGFKEIEKLNIHSDERKDTVYSTQFKMKPFDKNTYKLILEEKWYALWEGSHVDKVSLKDSEGKECELIKAIHSKLGDVTDLIKESDDLRVEIKPGERIELGFTGCSGNDFTLSVEGYNPWGGFLRFFKLGLGYTNILTVTISLALLFAVILVTRRLTR